MKPKIALISVYLDFGGRGGPGGEHMPSVDTAKAVAGRMQMPIGAKSHGSVLHMDFNPIVHGDPVAVLARVEKFRDACEAAHGAICSAVPETR